MNWYLQLELPHDVRCRLAMPSVYVSRFHISWHWDPDALARWYTMIPTCRLVHKGEPPAQKLLLVTGLALGNCCGMKNGKVASLEWF